VHLPKRTGWELQACRLVFLVWKPRVQVVPFEHTTCRGGVEQAPGGQELYAAILDIDHAAKPGHWDEADVQGRGQPPRRYEQTSVWVRMASTMWWIGRMKTLALDGQWLELWEEPHGR
jgi:hypothetical protein